MKNYPRHLAALSAAFVLIVPAILFAAAGTTHIAGSPISDRSAECPDRTAQHADRAISDATHRDRRKKTNTSKHIESDKPLDQKNGYFDQSLTSTDLRDRATILQLAAAINVKQASIQSDQAALGESLRILVSDRITTARIATFVR